MHENGEEEGKASRSSIKSPVKRRIPTRTQSYQETIGPGDSGQTFFGLRAPEKNPGCNRSSGSQRLCVPTYPCRVSGLRRVSPRVLKPQVPPRWLQKPRGRGDRSARAAAAPRVLAGLARAERARPAAQPGPSLQGARGHLLASAMDTVCKGTGKMHALVSVPVGTGGQPMP
ncbi:hypothetical protein ACRRTK_023342 [Alexandromys fortis]